jgi:uncharacterized lipoprotein YddW (UPF0748 family)
MRSLALLPVLVLAGCAGAANAPIPGAPAPAAPRIAEPPQLPREFRGVWVATVGNRDWPSRPGLPVEQQQAELIRILDEARRLHLNAVVLQVRPSADAFYQSSLEPWSEFLTGAMGVTPEPLYDPLAFAVAAAHERGLELHAWFNPYRARYSSVRSPASTNHISNQRPDLVMTYGPFVWMDPGEPPIRDYSLNVIADVVKRYDIDGVHIDDYFYPYQERDAAGKLIPFPDDASFARYRATGGELQRDDWRRHNIDLFVEALYRRVKEIKPAVKVGISPFGIWRPGYPKSVWGMDAYTEIYADARKWLREGWVDYFVPQLYWKSDAPQQDYRHLLRWWVDQNQKDRHIWAGNAPYRVLNNVQNWPVAEIVKQIRLTRSQPGATGNVHFSMAALLRNRGGLADSLLAQSYAGSALVPASTWLDNTPPAAPTARFESHALLGPLLTIECATGEAPFLWAIRLRIGDEWFAEVVPATQKHYVLRRGKAAVVPVEVAITAVDRNGNESPVLRIAVPQ